MNYESEVIQVTGDMTIINSGGTKEDILSKDDISTYVPTVHVYVEQD